MIHWETLDPQRTALIKKLAGMSELRDFYLAGGTALSLQLGLRKSFDFNFFSYHSFSERVLLSSLEKTLGSKGNVITLEEGTCHVAFHGIQLSFFFYPHRLLRPLVKEKDLPGVALASLADLAAMKFSAIASRSVKKDFYDLYHLLRVENWTAQELLSLMDKKYGKEGWGKGNAILALTYFQLAENDPLPSCFVPCDWEKIKVYFLCLQKEMFAIA
jgi:hypothetical protein